MDNEFISGIASGAMVARLNISTYSGRKLDRKSQETVIANNNSASTKAASVYKSLFAECKELEAIIKYGAKVRIEHYRLTKPWDDFGTRLLPASLIMEYTTEKARWERDFNALVQEFLDVYEDRVTAAAFQLGSLFDRSEYPPRAKVAQKFGINVDFEVLPTAGDWRLDMDAEHQEKLVKQYEKRFEERIEALQMDNWQQLYGVINKFSEKLAVVMDENGAPKLNDKGEPVRNKLYESMLDNARDTCDLLKSLNITKDPALEKARQQLENALYGVKMEDLKKSEGERVLVKQRMDAILSAFDFSGLADDA